MCGFVGFANTQNQPASRAIIKAMADKIIHRGPDGEGYWGEDAYAVGHRRLAIIDVREIANQPMTSPNGRYAMVYNGEIYNFKALRQRLKSVGYQFKSDGDSEVLLSAFQEWGTDAFLELNGMFAVAIYDRETKRVTLARDRFGVKPLYYQFRNGVLGFASEAKALFAHPDLKPKLNAEGLSEYLHFMNFITDQTLFEGVRLFPAGHFVEIDTQARQPDGHQLQSTSYWDFRFTGDSPEFSKDEMADNIHQLFNQAVKRQMISDVGVSSFLSGGVDSGSITAIAANEVPLLRSFTAGFDTHGAGHDAGFDERDGAEIMARAFRTAHYGVLIKSDDFERTLGPLCYHLDEPRVGQSYPNYLASELASKFEKVVLSGCGGDELFGGYTWRYFQGVPATSFDDYIDRYYKFWRRLVSDDQTLNHALAPLQGAAKGFDGRAAFESIYPEDARRDLKPESLLNWSLYFEAKTFMNGLLVVEDKVAMAHSLETRVPFLDNDLVDYACQIPIQAKLSDIPGELAASVARQKSGETFVNARSDGKAILRHMMQRLVPDEISQRKKQGFSAPDSSWFRHQSADFIRGKLQDKTRRLQDVINPAYIDGILTDHMENGENKRLQIWSLLHLNEVIETHNL